MKIIDTHSHIYDDQFDDDIDAVIARAKEAGVEKILLPNIDIPSIKKMHSLVDKYPNYCYPMMGLHPCDVKADWMSVLSEIKAHLTIAKYSYVAIGEIGIDLYWDKTYKKEQEQAFAQQLEWSIEYDLPIAIHSRNSIPECVEIIKEVSSNKLRGVFHSFSSSLEDLELILPLDNFYMGINGIVTYKNSTLKEVLTHTDLSRIIIETDAPYLSPVPHRGKRNESSYTQYVVKKLAEIYNLSENEVCETTCQNAESLFF